MTSAATRPETAPAAPKNAPEGVAINTCLNRIRRRLFVVRAVERVAVALLYAAAIGAAFFLARYLRQRFEIWAVVAAVTPALLVGGYWLARLRYRALAQAQSPVCMFMVSGLTLLLVTAAAVTLFATAYWARLPLWSFAAAPLAVFALAAIFSGRTVSPQAAAIFVDQQVGLKERVSTAYEILHRTPATPEETRFHAPIVASAVVACQQIRKARVGYGRLDRRVYIASAVAAAVAVSVTFIQPLPALATRSSNRADPRTAVALKDLQAKVAELVIDKAADPSKNAVLDPLKQTVQELQQADGSKLEAFAAIQRGQAEYQKELDRFNSAEKTQGALGKDPELGQMSQAIQKLKDSLARESKSGDPASAQARSNAEKDLAGAAKDLANKLASGNMTPEEKAGLAAALDKASKAAGNDPGLQKSLEDAKNALANGDAGKLEQSLKAAGAQLGSDLADKANNESTAKDAMAALDSAAKTAAQSGGSKDGGDNQTASNNSGNSGENAGSPGNTGSPNGGNPENGNSPSGSGENQSAQNQPGGDNQSGGGNQSNGEGSQDPSANSGNKSGDSEGGQHTFGNSQPNSSGQGSDPGKQGGSQDGQGGMTGTQSGTAMGPGDPGSNNGEENGVHTNQFMPGGPGGKTNSTEIGGQGIMPGGTKQGEIATAGSKEKANGVLGKSGPAVGNSTFMGSADRGNQPLTDYDRAALEAARKRAEDFIQRGETPPQYRELIRNFYGSQTPATPK